MSALFTQICYGEIMKKLFLFICLGFLMTSNANADREYALEVLSRKFSHGVDSFILAVFFGVIAFIISQLFKFSFKINIEFKYYYIVFMGVGIVLTKYLLQ